MKGLLYETLLKASGYPVIRQKITLKQQGSGYEIAGHYFDQVILAAGAWLPDLLMPLGYQVDVRPQRDNSWIMAFIMSSATIIPLLCQKVK